MGTTADMIATAHATAPHGYVRVSTSVVAGKPRSTFVAAVISVDGDTVTYTSDGVWYSRATRSEIVAWELIDAFDTDGPWVSIVFVDGDDYEAAVDAANDDGGSVEAVAAYLSQWDYGDETDAAQTRDSAPWGSADTLHTVTAGGTAYVLSVNHSMGYYALQRRPLSL